MGDCPKFSLEGSKYDQSTYKGRFLGFLEVIDPRCLFISDAQLETATKLLADFDYHQQTNFSQRLPEGVTDEDLWHAKKVRDAVIHPGTGEMIPAPFRMAAFLPANVPIIAGMLNYTSIPATVFWQWTNQSYNSALNYANRSGSDISMEDVTKSYGLAVGVSCSLALGFRYLSTKGPKAWRSFASIPFIIPFISVASAGSANVYFSRQKEIENGIPIFDEDNNKLGLSREAAKAGIQQTILSRSIGLPIPVLVMPYLLMKGVPKSTPPRTKMIFELAAITVSVAIALPMAIAIFPQKLELKTSKLEKEFQELKNKNGEIITKVYSNKGL